MKYISPDKAAEKLGVCKKTILKMIKDGEIKAVRSGSRLIRIPENFIEKLKGCE